MEPRAVDLQWQRILDNDKVFSEEATISDGQYIIFTVKGAFCSGTSREEGASAYAMKRLVPIENFMVSSMSVPYFIEDPWNTLKGMTLYLDERGKSFTITDISGRRSGSLTLYLREKNDAEADGR